MDVLAKMEAIPSTAGDRPERDIRIREVSVLVDPFEEYKARLKRKLEHEANADIEEEHRRKLKKKEDSMGWFGPKLDPSKANSGGGVGKYLQSASKSSGVATPVESVKKVKATTSKQTYGNFDNF